MERMSKTQIRPLSDELQQKAISELNENPNQIEEYLAIFKEWLSKQEHLKYNDDDQLLLSFLRASKYSIERAKEKLDAFYTFRTAAPDIAQNLNPLAPDVQGILNIGIAFPIPLPKHDLASSLIIIITGVTYDPEIMTSALMAKLNMINFIVLLNKNDNIVISGVKIVWDLKSLHYKSAVQCTPLFIKKVMQGFLRALPLRFKGVYFLNMPLFFEPVVNLAKQFMPEKMRNRLFFYSSNTVEKLYEHVPRTSLPFEYGGDAGSLNEMAAEWKAIVEDNNKMLQNENDYYSIESKRPGGCSDMEDVFGIQGTFKKLQID